MALVTLVVEKWVIVNVQSNVILIGLVRSRFPNADIGCSVLILHPSCLTLLTTQVIEQTLKTQLSQNSIINEMTFI